MADKPKILVTRKLPEPVEQRLSGLFQVQLNKQDTAIDPETLIKISDNFDGLLVTPTEVLSTETIEKLPKSIKIVATFSVGYDHIDVPAAASRGICVTNTPEVLSDATADIAMLLLLGAARGAYWGEKMVREETWGRWSPTAPMGIDVSGKRLGILGMGRIGRCVAKRARGFGMEIHYHNTSRLEESLEQGAVFHQTVEDLLPNCDFLSINCASTRQTRQSIDMPAIARLPRGAVVINTARGDIIDDDALINALKSGHVGAAGLDVFNNEPDIDPRYRAMENVFLLPHLGSATPQTRINMGMRAVDNLESFFNGTVAKDML